MIFQDLSRRLILSLASLVVIILTLTFSNIFFVKWIIALLVATLCAIGIWEYGMLTKIKKGYINLLITIGIGIILSFFSTTFTSNLIQLPIVIFFIGVILIFAYHFNKITDASSSIAKGFFRICYVALPLALLLKILYLTSPSGHGEAGNLWVLYLLIVTKMTDIGAYFGGRLLGKQKLAIDISPGKTVVGSVIGFISAIVFSVAFHVVSLFVSTYHLTFVQSLWLGAILGCLGQFGDLSESLLKRDADVKDSNRLPGLGGILDMLDSLLFTIPVIFLFLFFG